MGEDPAMASYNFPIAVVGIGCRMPGGVNDTKAFWKALIEGKECIQDIPPERWAIDNFYDEDHTSQGKMVTKRCGFIDNVNDFDNLFFKISPREAASMDPQQRSSVRSYMGSFRRRRSSSCRRGSYYTVIKGSLIADNGNSSSLTMPSVPAMEYVMTETYKKFGVPCLGSISWKPMAPEHHRRSNGGRSNRKSFAPKRNTPLKFGSIKGNFGHTEIAAGTASAIKIALMMENRMLVPTINFVKPNHMIDMDAWKLNLLTEAEPFSDEKYIIGLNSFGFAGALAHCIFEEPPKIKQREPSSSCGWHFGEDSKEGKAILVPLSAKSPEAVVAVARQWSDFENERDALGVVSWLATHRTHFDYRMSVIANSGQQFRNQLHDFIESGSSDKVLTTTVYSNEKPKVCLIFPGQGQQWVDMGRQLYQTEEIFKNVIDACDAIFEEISGWSLLRDRRLFVKATEGEVVGKEVFNDLEVSQPAILFLQIAYFRLLEYWGVVPDAIVGHSLGEVAAAYAAGGLTLEEAILVIYIRSVEQGKTEGNRQHGGTKNEFR
ncbi:hypothetical protein BSL78_22138 [Apostichopus japonicus]|uniref:Polyketide synthase n=1 Tax=Stichopus japonicus TaxID=307972 RepID=A0A2G8JZ45_STIJA|nr:hypothetical protein BSL78_22138 [Apostichopus japonicus]